MPPSENYAPKEFSALRYLKGKPAPVLKMKSHVLATKHDHEVAQLPLLEDIPEPRG